MDEQWFKKRQKAAGVTAADIAARMGRDRSAVSRILHGEQAMSLPWARAFADALGVSVDRVLEKSGALPRSAAQELAPGFAESDVAACTAEGASLHAINRVADTLGGGGRGLAVWQVRSRAMALQGFLVGDYVAVDTEQAERCTTGDTVIAELYDHRRQFATTLLRRLEPPVLVAASADPADRRVHVVDGTNVAITGRVVACWRKVDMA